MKQPCKVSLILPVYNTPEPFLREAIESALSQSLREVEFILVDNQSTDGTYEICEEYAKQDGRIRLFRNQVNGGIAYSRNRGASLATGEYLYFMDSDDILEERALACLYEKATSENLEVVLFDWDNIDKSPTRYHYPPSAFAVQTGQSLFLELIRAQWRTGRLWIGFYDRKSFEARNLKFDSLADTTDDELFFFQNLHTASRVCAIPDLLYHYRIHGSSITVKPSTIAFFYGRIYWYHRVLLLYKEYGIAEADLEGYRIYFQYVRDHVLHTNIHLTKEANPVLQMTLENTERLFLQMPILEQPPKDFYAIRKDYPNLCFFGAGDDGETTLKLFRWLDYPLPLAFCDNRTELQGTTLEGIPIMSLEQAKEKFPDLAILITSRRYQKEIFQQLNQQMDGSRVFTLPTYA